MCVPILFFFFPEELAVKHLPAQHCPESTAVRYTLVVLIMNFAFWYTWIQVLWVPLIS